LGKYQLRMKVRVVLSPAARVIGRRPSRHQVDHIGADHPLGDHLVGVEGGQQPVVGQVTPELAQGVVPAAAIPLRLGGGRGGDGGQRGIAVVQVALPYLGPFVEDAARLLIITPTVCGWAVWVAAQIAELVVPE